MTYFNAASELQENDQLLNTMHILLLRKVDIPLEYRIVNIIEIELVRFVYANKAYCVAKYVRVCLLSETQIIFLNSTIT